MKNDILMWHGVDPLRVQMIRNQLNPRRINAVRFLKQKSCRTLVTLSRASTSFLPYRKKDVDGRDKPGHDEEKPASGFDAEACGDYVMRS
jgi:hypothetical protein